MTESQQTDWQTDWLYSLIFQQADDAWQMCRRNPDSKYCQYLLIGQWSEADDSMCRGNILRAWMRNDEGLQEITIEQYNEHKKKIRERIYPFILIQFHISGDRQHVVYGHREASTAGSGCRYNVVGAGESAKLTPDPSGGMWIS